jgi:hypothetical protein
MNKNVVLPSRARRTQFASVAERKAQTLNDISYELGNALYELPFGLASVVDDSLTAVSYRVTEALQSEYSEQRQELNARLEHYQRKKAGMMAPQGRVSPASWSQLTNQLRSVYRQLALACWDEAIVLPASPVSQLIAQADRARAATDGLSRRPYADRAPYRVLSFDLNLTRTLEGKLLASPRGAKDDLRRRMSERFDRWSPFWFVIEFEAARLHLHGTLGHHCRGSDFDHVEESLRGVGGWLHRLTDAERDARPFAVKVIPIEGFQHLIRRATYPLKGLDLSRTVLDRHPVVCNQELNRAAQKIHAFHRDLVRRMIARDQDDARAA